MEKVNGTGPNGSDDNCKLEFDYACLRKGTANMIAVVMEPSMRSTKGWVGVVGGVLRAHLRWAFCSPLDFGAHGASCRMFFSD